MFVIDDWQGPTDAVARCVHCGTYTLLRMLHWGGRNLSRRIFATAPLPAAAVEVFLRNMKSAYCDLSRHQAETDALAATAEPVDGGVIVTVPEMAVIARLPRDELGETRIRSWREETPDERDPFWNAIIERVAG